MGHDEECEFPFQECCNNVTCLFKPSGTVCRLSRGVCDLEDVCSGAQAECVDITQPAGFVCNDTSTEECIVPMVCGNSISTCLPAIVLVKDSCGICGGDNQSCTVNGTCGDGKCFGNETCGNCVLDCGACPSITCENDCNGRGTCDNGVCNCIPNWSGSSCDTEIQHIDPSVNGTDVVIAVGEQVYFSVKLKDISEIAPNSSVVSSFTLNTQNLSGVAEVVNNTKTWSYNIELSNAAVIILRFTMTGNTSLPVTFANITRILQPYSIKLSVEIVNWPFTSYKNVLQVSMAIEPDQTQLDQCNFYNSSSDNSGNVRWTEFTVDQVTLYGSFLDYALVDQFTKPMQVKAENSGAILTLTLPHFWVHAVIDPDFSVILGKPLKPEDPCYDQIDKESSELHTAAMVAGIVVGGIALAAMAIGAFFLWKKKARVSAHFRSMASVEMHDRA